MIVLIPATGLLQNIVLHFLPVKLLSLKMEHQIQGAAPLQH